MSDADREIKISIKTTSDAPAQIGKATEEVNKLTGAVQAQEAANKSQAEVASRGYKQTAEASRQSNEIITRAVKEQAEIEAQLLGNVERKERVEQSAAQANRLRHQERIAFIRAEELAIRSETAAEKSALSKSLAQNVAGESEESGSSGRSASGLIRTVSRAVPGFSRLGQVAAALTGPLAGVAAGFVVVTGAVAAALKGIQDFSKVQGEVRSLNTALASTGKFSQALSESIQDVANAQEKGTGLGADKWLGSLTEFIRSGAKPAEIADLAKGLENLTGISGNYAEASGLLKNALEGNFDGFHKLGIEIDETATQAEKIRQVLERSSAGAGLMASSTDDASGSMSRFGNEAWHASVTLGNLASSFAMNNWAVRGVFGALSLLNDWTGRTVSATANLMASINGVTPGFLDEKKAIAAVNKELEDNLKYLDSVDKATQRKIEQDKKAVAHTKTQIQQEKEFKDDQIHRAELIGAMSPRQAAEAREKNELDSQDATYRAEQAQKARELKQRKDQQAQIDDEIQRAGNASQGAHEKLDHGFAVQSQIDQKAIQLRDIQGKLPTLQDQSAWSPGKGLELKEAFESANALIREIGLLKKEQGGSISQLKQGVEKADLERDQAQKAYQLSNENLSRIQSLETDLNNFKADAAGQRAITKLRGDNAIAEAQARESGSTKGIAPAQQGFKSAEAEADRTLNPPPPPRRRPIPGPQYGPLQDTSHVQPGAFGRLQPGDDESSHHAQEVISNLNRLLDQNQKNWEQMAKVTRQGLQDLNRQTSIIFSRMQNTRPG